MFIVFAVPLRLLGALALALLLYRRFRGVAAYRTAGYLPTVVPDVAYALLWLWIFNPLYGPLNLALGSLGGPTPSWLTDPRAAQWAVIIMSLFTIGEGFIVAMATRQAISPSSTSWGTSRARARTTCSCARHAPGDGADAAPAHVPRHDLLVPGELRAGPDRHRGGRRRMRPRISRS